VPIDRSTEVRAADRYFTSHEIAVILQVTPSSVVKWINEGILSAFRTPGGHRRVSATELVRFAQEFGMPIPEALRELAVAKVLVVDDEPKFLTALQRGFKPHAGEFRLETTDNGMDALMLIGSIKPDVLILDLHMKTLDGFEVLKRMKANPETNHTVVIALSGHMDSATSERCKKLGASACLQKPASVQALLDTLRALRKLRA
jgi:excisionase family DNA binding protein